MSRVTQRRSSILLLLAAMLLGTASTIAVGDRSGRATASDEALPQQALDEHELNCYDLPELSPDLPGAPRRLDGTPTDQNIFNCFAWQEFIALNWPSSPDEPGQPDRSMSAAQFGDPLSGQPVVWETYKGAYEVFLPNAEPPTAWGAQQEMPEICRDVVDGEGGRAIPAQTSKFSVDAQVLNEFGQANAAVSDPSAWLTAQNGHRAHYEVRMNEVEFDYIIENEFYNAIKQYEAVQEAIANGGPGIYFPKGTPDTQGAIEIKAAWLELDDPGLWNRYLTTVAYIYDEQQADPDCRKAVVGLIGLHIIQKSSDQWTWATFEHVQNAPSIEEIRGLDLLDRYRFYNHGCRLDCLPNKRPGADQPYDQPIPVVRIKDIADEESWGSFTNNVASLNSYVQQMIREANPGSVFQHYELVGVGWPTDVIPNNQVTTDPLPYKVMVPDSLANSVMETYFQTPGINCSDCHSVAHIAPSSREQHPQWRSDYSFLLSRADEPEAGE